MNYALTDVICRFARVFHVRDLIRAYASVKHASEASFKAPASDSKPGTGAGSVILLPSRHERGLSGLSGRWGSAVGGVLPPSSMVIERSPRAKRSDPLNRVREHASCARNAHAPGHSTYLMITVPVDTILIIKDLQRILSKMVCHFVLF